MLFRSVPVVVAGWMLTAMVRFDVDVGSDERRAVLGPMRFDPIVHLNLGAGQRVAVVANPRVLDVHRRRRHRSDDDGLRIRGAVGRCDPTLDFRFVIFRLVLVLVEVGRVTVHRDGDADLVVGMNARDGDARIDTVAREGQRQVARDRKSTRLNSSHIQKSRMPSSA